MKILNEEEKLNKNIELLKYVDCNISLEEKYSYFSEWKKKFV